MVSGSVLPSSTEVLPTRLAITTALRAPGSVTVQPDGTFSFPLAARLGQYGMKDLQVFFDAASGRIERTVTIDVRAPALVEQLNTGLPVRNAAWRFPALGITEFTPRVADAVIYRVTTEFDGGVQLSLGTRVAGPTPCVPVCLSCQCFVVVLLERLQRLVSVQPVSLDGGVQGKLQDGGAPETTITLLRWQHNLDAGIVTQPLVDPDGRVVVATDRASLARFDQHGAALPARSFNARELVSLTLDPGVTLGLDDDVLYVSGNLEDGGSRVWALRADGGVSSYASQRETRSALALAKSTPDDAGLGVLVHFSPPSASGKPGQLLHATAELVGDAFDLFGEDETPTTGAENLVVSRSPGDAFSMVSLQVRRASGDFGVVRYELPSLNVFADAGFWGLTERATGLAAPFGSGPGLVASSPAGVTRLPAPRVAPPAASAPTLDRFGGIWVGTSAGVTWLGADGGTQSIPGTSGAAVSVSPVLVASTSRSFSWVYAVTTAGELNAIRADGPSPGIDWRDSLPLSPFGADVRIPLTVTCDRPRGRTNAILYVVDRDKLLSLLVPGSEPDIDAPWPMQRRDPLLSGNSELRFDPCR